MMSKYTTEAEVKAYYAGRIYELCQRNSYHDGGGLNQQITVIDAQKSAALIAFLNPVLPKTGYAIRKSDGKKFAAVDWGVDVQDVYNRPRYVVHVFRETQGCLQDYHMEYFAENFTWQDAD